MSDPLSTSCQQQLLSQGAWTRPSLSAPTDTKMPKGAMPLTCFCFPVYLDPKSNKGSSVGPERAQGLEFVHGSALRVQVPNNHILS